MLDIFSINIFVFEDALNNIRKVAIESKKVAYI